MTPTSILIDAVACVGRERNNVGVHLFKIKRPEKGNQLGNAWKKRDRKPVSPEEAYTQKVASVLLRPFLASA